jgi:hypothetical protein
MPHGRTEVCPLLLSTSQNANIKVHDIASWLLTKLTAAQTPLAQGEREAAPNDTLALP